MTCIYLNLQHATYLLHDIELIFIMTYNGYMYRGIIEAISTLVWGSRRLAPLMLQHPSSK